MYTENTNCSDNIDDWGFVGFVLVIFSRLFWHEGPQLV